MKSLKALLFVFMLSFFACQPGNSNRGMLPSSLPIRYSVGEVDPRFGITRERFLTLVGESEAIWEKAHGQAFFEYDPTAQFQVQLIFDDRQQRTLEAREAKAQLDTRESSIRSLMREHTAISAQHDALKNRYESTVASFNKRLDRHNEVVAEWNTKGGAPPEVFARIKEEERRINEARSMLDRERTELNRVVEQSNALAERINSLASRYNLEVSMYNGQFVETREFEQGQYDGKGIKVYQFTEESDLRVALMHEFGHALGFGHVANPEAIMNRRLGKQDMRNPRLTNDDLELLNSVTTP